MSKVGWLVLILIIIFALFLFVGNLIEVPYTAMITYTENESYIAQTTERVNESYIAEECEPIYGPPKPGEIICPEPKEGSMTLCYAVDYLGDLIGENCTNVTKWRWTLKPKNITLEREVQKQRPETFYRPLFEEWNLDNLLLGNIKGKFIQTLSTIKFQSLSLSSL